MERDRRRTAFALYFAISALVLFRTLPYVLWGRAAVDSDEVLFGLMGKHLAEGREIPVFRWGLSYLLAVSSYLSAPLFRLFGVSVALMRLPMLLLNLVVANLLVFLLRRDSGLRIRDAVICSLWFLLPSMLASRELVLADYGVIESFVCLLLCWVLRKVPLGGGFLCGIGFAVRPFAVYGIPGILLMDARAHGLRRAFGNAVKWLLGMAASYSVILYFGRLSPYYRGNSLPFYSKRPLFMLEDIRGFFAEILTKTTGLQVQRLGARLTGPIQSRFNGLGLFLCAVGAILLVVLVRRAWKDRSGLWAKLGEKKYQFAFYLVLIGIVNFAAYVVQGPASDDIRYTHSLLLGLVGLYVLARQLPVAQWVRALLMVLVLGATLNNIYANGRNLLDLRAIDQRHPAADLLAYLHAHRIQALVGGDYFYASYNITFLSDESVIVSDDNWYPPYGRVFRETPPSRRAKIQLQSCPGGEHVGDWYVCPIPAKVSR